MALTCSRSGVAERSPSTEMPCPVPPSRWIRPMSRDCLPSLATTNAIRAPSAATRASVIRPGSPGTATDTASFSPSSRTYRRGRRGSPSATHRSPWASQLGVVSRSSGVGPSLVTSGSPNAPPDASEATYSEPPPSATPAAVCSSRDTATDRSSLPPSPSGPGTGTEPVPVLPVGIRTTRCLPSMKYMYSGRLDAPCQAVDSARSSVSSHSRSSPAPRSSTDSSVGARFRRVNSSCVAISVHLPVATWDDLRFSGTVSLFWSSGASPEAFLRSAVPVGKLDLTTGPSQVVGPFSSDRTSCVIGSTLPRTNTGSATATGCPPAPTAVSEAK